ncbi:MAG: hypothetical protein IJP02_04835 [Oscillospiraceae bacterium]|nr:hypothetical protein [Oscillospiraceae bacterium]
MKRMHLICAVLALLLAGQCVTPALAADGAATVYEQTAPSGAQEGNRLWPANTTASTGSVVSVDGTVYRTYDFAVAQESFRTKGEGLTIQLADLELDTSKWGEMELVFSYALEDKLDPVVDATEDFRVYASTDGGKTWSDRYANIKRHDAVGYAEIDSSRKAVLYRMTSEDIAGLVKEGQVIDRLKLMPYGTFTNLWYSLRVTSICINAYEGKSTVEAPKEEYITLGEQTVRDIVVNQAYEILSYPWTVDKLFVTDNHGSPLNHYPGWLYKGPVYVGTGIDSSWEMYKAAHDASGKYISGLTSQDAIGMQCINYTYAAIAAVTPTKLYSLGIAKYVLPLLGTLKNEPFTHEAPDIIRANEEKAVYEAYAQLKPGDLAMNTGHARIVTVAPKVVYKADGTIDPAKSAVGLSETAGSNQYFWLTPAGESVVSVQAPDEYKKANPTHTYLYGTTMRVDLAYTFAQLYDSDYLPYTLPEYAEGKVAKQRVEAIVYSDAATVAKNGFKAVVSSNYYVASTTLTLTDAAGKVIFTETTAAYESQDAAAYVSSAALDAALKGLGAGKYEIALDVSSGPVTRILGKPPVTRACTMAFTVA